MSSKRLREKLKNKEYRDEYVSANVAANIAFQIRALRKQRDWSQEELGGRMQETAGQRQPVVSRLEMPGKHNYNISTLKKLASAFDVALMIRFVPYSDLVNWVKNLGPESHNVESFDDDTGLREDARQEDLAITVDANQEQSTSTSNVIYASFSRASSLREEDEEQTSSAPTGTESNLEAAYAR